MTNKIYWNAWLEQYQPETDEDGDPARIERIELPKDIDNHLLWTELDDLNGTIVPGYHWVNSLNYYVCRVPWIDESIEVTDLITKGDYKRQIKRYLADGDDEAVEQLREQMDEEFPDAL